MTFLPTLILLATLGIFSLKAAEVLVFLKKIAFDGVCEYSEDFFEKCEMRQDGLEQYLIFFGKILICFPDFSYKSVFYFCFLFFLKYGILESMQNFIYVYFFLGRGSGFFMTSNNLKNTIYLYTDIMDKNLPIITVTNKV